MWRRVFVQRWIGAIPDVLWAPATAGVLMLLVGAIALATRHPWLFPSLGPTAFLQVETPRRRTADGYHVVMGHLVGMGAGFLAVELLGAASTPPAVEGGPLGPARLGAAVLAVAITMLVQLVLRASHAPAVATTMLITLGAFGASAQAASAIATGVILMAILGGGLRRLRLSAQGSGAAGPGGEGHGRGAG